ERARAERARAERARAERARAERVGTDRATSTPLRAGHRESWSEARGRTTRPGGERGIARSQLTGLGPGTEVAPPGRVRPGGPLRVVGSGAVAPTPGVPSRTRGAAGGGDAVETETPAAAPEVAVREVVAARGRTALGPAVLAGYAVLVVLTFLGGMW